MELLFPLSRSPATKNLILLSCLNDSAIFKNSKIPFSFNNLPTKITLIFLLNDFLVWKLVVLSPLPSLI